MEAVWGGDDRLEGNTGKSHEGPELVSGFEIPEVADVVLLEQSLAARVDLRAG